MSKDRLFLGYETAFWIWRKAGPLALAVLRPSRVRSLAGGAPTQAKIAAFASDHPDLRTENIDVLVQDGDQRKLPGVKVHVVKRQLPDRSFYRLEPGVYVASPELTLIQLASKLPVDKAVKLAMEMCGDYAIDPYASRDPDPDSDEDGICKRPPLTSRQKLQAYADRAFKEGSRARCLAFIRWTLDGSASPRETALAMLLCLPVRLGGYGFAPPELNARIDLTLEERLMMKKEFYRCDCYWEGKRTAVEYDSRRYHTAEEKQELDAIRRNMLLYKNVNVIVATRLQVNKASQFDVLAHQIARKIGKRMRPPTKKDIEARRSLRKTLFSWDLFPEMENWLTR